VNDVTNPTSLMTCRSSSRSRIRFRTGRRTSHGGLATALAAALTASALGADVAIEQVAPPTSIVVAGTKDFSTAKQRFDRTGFAELLAEPALHQMFEQMSGMSIDDIMGQLDDTMKDVGLDGESMVMPSGAAGLAFYMWQDDETGLRVPGMLVMADFGEQGDDFEAMLTKLVKQGVDAGEVEVESDELMGRTLWRLVNPNPMTVDPGTDPMGMNEEFNTLFIARDEGRFLLCTREDPLASAFARLDGEVGASLTEREDFQGAMTMIDGKQDAYAVVLFGGIFDMVGMMQPQAAMARPMISRFVGDMRAVSYGVRFDGPKAMMEASVGLFMPMGKSGLSALFDSSSPRGELPSFVGADTVSYSRLNFEFDQLMGLVSEIMGMMMPMMGGGGQEEIEQMKATISPILAPLGNTMHMTTTFSKPLTDDSMGGGLAIECTDAKAFEDAISAVAPMAGMEPRDFAGKRIYSMGMNPMMGMPGMDGGVSLGIGSGFVHIGPDQTVEGALRMGGDRAAGLAESDGYRRAVACLGRGEVIGWGYTDSMSAVEAQIESQRRSIRTMIDQWREFDEEMADEMAADMKPMLDAFEAFDPDLFRRHIGPGAWEVRSTDRGFVMHAFQLSGSDDE